MTNAPALEIEKLSYVYKGNWLVQRLHAVKDLTLTVSAGESFGFLGHNGAGKTTTMKCLLGLIRPTTGTIRILGGSNTDRTVRKAVGYLPEQPYFYDHLTVQEIMEMYAQLYGLRGGDARNAIHEAIDLVKMNAKLKARMRTLSKGLTQRVGMAQAILAKPKLLILDEPFSGLDPIGRKEFKDVLALQRARGATIFICSHILSDVEFLCDRVSIMAHGALKGVFDIRNRAAFGGGTFELVVRDDGRIGDEFRHAFPVVRTEEDIRGKRIVLQFPERGVAETALRAALAAHATIESFESVNGSLEDLFVKLVQFEEAGKGK
jgi:ABC-2 type transport system ATP-binding protein